LRTFFVFGSISETAGAGGSGAGAGSGVADFGARDVAGASAAGVLRLDLAPPFGSVLELLTFGGI
jgi:hypothetical protein